MWGRGAGWNKRRWRSGGRDGGWRRRRAERGGPRGGGEQEVEGIWGEVLQLEAEKIGVGDNFFELGGDSLLATQVVAKIRRRWEMELPLKAVFERPSVGELAELIDKGER